jgi:hypothetical protein
VTQEILTRLNSDSDYYGTFGKQFLSNSDIGALLKDPSSFGKDKEKTVPMVQGSYFHASLLEPEKVVDFLICDVSSRNTNRYKEMCESQGADIILLSKEVEELDAMVDSIKGRMDFFDMIYEDGNLYEQPGISNIMGETWKGKADIISSEYVIDLKTTANIEEFKYSARKYNYDSQAYIYNQIFGKPVLFIAVEKGTNKTGMFDCSEEFLDRGKEKVQRAIEVWRKFFGPNKTEDITQYYTKETL